MQVEQQELIEQAQQGDRDALEKVLMSVQDQTHHLAMRMLVNPHDAEEATQDILVRIMTRISTFQHQSAFKTWCYKIAVNHLLNAKKIRDHQQTFTFDMFAEDLAQTAEPGSGDQAFNQRLANEVRISCTMAMLLCLDAAHRIAYILGDILEFDHQEASDILEVTPANYRARLSRARKKVVAFTSAQCGIANEKAKCRCPARVPSALKQSRILADKKSYDLPDAPPYNAVVEQARKLETELKTLKLQTATPFFKAPKPFAAELSRLATLQV
jgi:RNA polymerase sigma factor (sigma-70 family)